MNRMKGYKEKKNKERIIQRDTTEEQKRTDIVYKDRTAEQIEKGMAQNNTRKERKRKETRKIRWYKRVQKKAQVMTNYLLHGFNEHLYHSRYSISKTNKRKNIHTNKQQQQQQNII